MLVVVVDSVNFWNRLLQGLEVAVKLRLLQVSGMRLDDVPDVVVGIVVPTSDDDFDVPYACWVLLQ